MQDVRLHEENQGQTKLIRGRPRSRFWDAIVHKIEIGGLDHGLIKTVTIFRYDLLQR
jgi:hypothetical protein